MCKADIWKDLGHMFPNDLNIIKEGTPLWCSQTHRHLKTNQIYPILLFSILLTTRTKAYLLKIWVQAHICLRLSKQIYSCFYSTLQDGEQSLSKTRAIVITLWQHKINPKVLPQCHINLFFIILVKKPWNFRTLHFLFGFAQIKLPSVLLFSVFMHLWTFEGAATWADFF